MALLLGLALLLALQIGTEPRPPLENEPVALSSSLAMSLMTGAAALGPMVHGNQCVMAIARLFALTPLLPDGPQTHVDPVRPKILTVVIAARFAMSVTLCLMARRTIRLRRSDGRSLA